MLKKQYRRNVPNFYLALYALLLDTDSISTNHRIRHTSDRSTAAPDWPTANAPIITAVPATWRCLVPPSWARSRGLLFRACHRIQQSDVVSGDMCATTYHRPRSRQARHVPQPRQRSRMSVLVLVLSDTARIRHSESTSRMFLLCDVAEHCLHAFLAIATISYQNRKFLPVFPSTTICQPDQFPRMARISGNVNVPPAAKELHSPATLQTLSAFSLPNPSVKDHRITAPTAGSWTTAYPSRHAVSPTPLPFQLEDCLQSHTCHFFLPHSPAVASLRANLSSFFIPTQY